MQGPALYYYPTCPYCIKVLSFMKKNNLAIPLKNIHEDPRYGHELIKIGGSRQVPCLVIDGKALYESDDIIAWLNNNPDRLKA